MYDTEGIRVNALFLVDVDALQRPLTNLQNRLDSPFERLADIFHSIDS